MNGLYLGVFVGTLLGACVSAALFIFAWQRRKRIQGAQSFAVLELLIALTCLFYCAMWIAPTREWVYLFARLRFVGLSLMAVMFIIFVLDHTGTHPWRVRWHMALLFIVPVIVQAALWTNEAHSLFFESWDTVRIGPFTGEVITYGPAWRLHAYYSYGLLLLGIALLLRAAMRSVGVYAVQSLLMFFGALVILFVTIPVAFLLADQPIPSMTPISYSLAGAIFAFALQRQRLFELVPVALESVYNSMDDAVLVMDSHDSVVAINPAAEELLAVTRSEVLGKQMLDVIGNRPDLRRQIAAMENPSGEITDTGGSKTRFYDLRFSPVVRKGDPTGRVLVVRDVTERRHAERRAFELTMEQEKIRLLAGFIRDTSHDLRTPLTVMNTALYIARKTDDEDKRLAKLAEVEQQILHIQRIIDGLLLLTSLDTASTMEVSMFRLNALIEPLPTEIRNLIAHKQHRVTMDVPSDVAARGDVNLLRRAVHNLIHNAALYTPPGGQITVRAQVNGPKLYIEVQDNGVGIQPRDLEGIFDRFSKVNRARTPDGSGAGLGLAIVRKIAQIHSGEVSADSTPGEGSTFRMILPASQRPLVAALPAAAVLNS